MTEFNTPTRDFYEKDKRSAILRNLCLEALDAAGVMLVDEDKDNPALLSLIDINSRLDDMGIEPGMHVIPSDIPRDEAEARRNQLINDPVMASEWIAGQVRKALIHTNAFKESGSPEVLAEHDELLGDGGEVSLIDYRSASPRARQFITGLGVTGALRSFLDYDAGPSELKD